jgi:phosphoribosylanthranilate isomerase
MQGIHQFIEILTMMTQSVKRPVKIKVCGMTDPENVEEVSALDPDFMGYIFFPGSPRFIGKNPDPALFRIPGERTARVGVFVNEDGSEVIRRFETCQLDLVQLHGKEPVEYCRTLVEHGIPVIKVFHPENPDRISDARMLETEMHGFSEAVHYFLFDSGGSGDGGSGHKLNWGRIGTWDIPLPFLLGGGIGPDDAGTLKTLDHPALYGVDVNSRFESSPGMKDAGLLDRFIRELRK